jgi:hypothetical protein
MVFSLLLDKKPTLYTDASCTDSMVSAVKRRKKVRPLRVPMFVKPDNEKAMDPILLSLDRTFAIVINYL